MDFSDIFRIVNLVAAVLMVLGAVIAFVNHSVQSIIIGVYVTVFGLSTALLEFQIPPQVARYASFMFSFLGRGAFYILMGSIVMDGNVLAYIDGGILVFIGIGYVVLEFIPSIEPPANMRDAEASGWGQEQI